MNTPAGSAPLHQIKALVRYAGYRVVEARSDPDVFGSWAITLETERDPIRVLLDGREGEVLLQRLAAGAGRGEVRIEHLWSSSAARTPAAEIVKRLRQTAAPASPPTG